MTVEFKNADKVICRELFRTFYPSSGKCSIISGSISQSDVDIDQDLAIHSVNEMAEEFACAIPEGVFSPAKVLGKCPLPRLDSICANNSVLPWIGFLLSFKTDPQEAVKQVSSWVQKQCSDVRKEGEDRGRAV